MKSYQELSQLQTYEERLKYLECVSRVGEEKFGADRYMNQALYNSPEWKKARRAAILRDEGRDLGVPGYEIEADILVHHINPITAEDIENRSPNLFDLDNLITTCRRTHDAIHYGVTESKKPRVTLERKPNDTCPWK